MADESAKPVSHESDVTDGQQETLISRPRLAGLCIAIGTGVSVLFCIGTTIVWDLQARQAGSISTYNWSPIDDLPSIICLLPFGLLMHSVFPFGWMFWLGFAATVRAQNPRWLMLCALGAMLFGMYWPKQCVGMLGI